MLKHIFYIFFSHFTELETLFLFLCYKLCEYATKVGCLSFLEKVELVILATFFCDLKHQHWKSVWDYLMSIMLILERPPYWSRKYQAEFKAALGMTAIFVFNFVMK